MKGLLLLVLLINSVLYAQNYQFLSAYNSKGVPAVMAPDDVIGHAAMAFVNTAFPKNNPVPVYYYNSFWYKPKDNGY